MKTLHVACRAAALAMVPAILAVAGTADAEEKTIRLLRAPVGAFEPLYIAQAMPGQVEIVMTGAVPLVAAVANGAPMVAILGAEGHENPPTTGLMVKADSPVQSLADLKGRKIGLPGIASPQGLATLLARAASSASSGTG